jgi:hypothetical protein
MCRPLLLLAGCGLAASVALAGEPAPALPPPRLEPDYTDLVLPPNIAPLNFAVREPGASFQARLRGAVGAPLEVHSRGATVAFPEAAWRQLLANNRGQSLLLEVSAQAEDAQWRRFATVTNRVAAEPIDPILIYRKLHPSHNSWHTMGLYQRDLRTFDEAPILENRRFDYDCCHCHALRNNDPNQAIVLIRSTTYRPSVLVVSNGTAAAIEGRAGFTAWHPKTNLLVSAFNRPKLLLHSAKPGDMRDIIELEGWLGAFRLGSPLVQRVPAGDPTQLLAFPAWAPDGAYLYYCRAPNPLANPTNTPAGSYATVKYDLLRLPYDSARDQWGEPEMVLSTADLGLSVAQPRLSPDGRWLFFCGTAYGCWPTYDPGSDLYGIDLAGGRANGKFAWRKLELNSPACESWLSWSANSRWVVFSSKRASPLFNRPYLAYVAPDGHCAKPFVLPQRDPAFYGSQLKTYTIPTLASGPVSVPQRALIQAIKAPHKQALGMPEGTGVATGAVVDHP